MARRNLDWRCKGMAKNGKPCRAAATACRLCYFHANPKKASELGRIGGRSKRPTVPEDAEPLPTLNSAVAVRNTVDRLIADVYADIAVWCSTGSFAMRRCCGLRPSKLWCTRCRDFSHCRQALQ
jgi:hypothetical protein